jgi:chorismate mutase/prephenate dehydrogenase
MLSKEDDATLEALRRNIDNIDDAIISLLARRKDQVTQVVALKKKHHRPAYHPAREENVVFDRRRRASETGLNPDHVEELFRCIMKESRMFQTARISRKALRPGAAVLLVGAGGGMGRFFGNWFRDTGYQVRELEKNDWHRAEELCDGIGLAVISVPINTTLPVIERIAPHLPSDCVLADLTSIKSAPMAAMLSAHPGPVVGLHPLFGPTTSTMDKQIIAAVPGRQARNCQWVLDQLAAWGAVPVETTAEEHDDIMAIVQSLRHFATFSFGRFLHRKQVDLQRSLDFSSPIYRLELGMVGRLFAQDAGLYSEIIFASPQRRDLLKDYVESLSENIEMLDKTDKAAFNDQFRKIAEWFDPFSQQAMRESTYLIDKLIERF